MVLVEWIKEHWIAVLILLLCVSIVVGIIVCICMWKYKVKRKKSRNGYTSIETPLALPDKLWLEKEKRSITFKEQALMSCQYYIRNEGHYSDIQQLDEIGHRDGKFWFLVHDPLLGRKQLLTSVPNNPKMVLPFNQETKNNIKKLFSLTEHPYIMPMSELEFLEEGFIIVVRSFSPAGSLKDEIYQSRCLDNHLDKYIHHGQPLPYIQVQTYANQILKALLFLQQNGFPPFGHLHSGNVILHNGICRLTEIESTLFQQSIHLYPTIKKKLADAPSYAISALTFAHLLFEMSTGFELDCAQPRTDHLTCCIYPDVTNVLDFIFNHKPGQSPTLEVISMLPFFRDVPHPVLQNYKPSHIPLPVNIKDQLRSVRKGKLVRFSSGKKLKKRRASTTSSRETLLEPTPSTSYTLPLEPLMSHAPLVLPTPPPPPPPPLVPIVSPPTSSVPTRTASSGRLALLSDIRKGTKLKKTDTSDRSSSKI